MFSDFYPQSFTGSSGSGSPNPLKRIPGLVSRLRTAPNYIDETEQWRVVAREGAIQMAE